MPALIFWPSTRQHDASEHGAGKHDSRNYYGAGMMAASGNLHLAHTGSYPRIGDGAELQILRRTIAAVDRGEATQVELRSAEDDMTRRAISDQARAGIDFVTDGMICWYDPISHLAAKLTGVEIHGLLRFFDTNFYFRQPLLTARPARRSPMLMHEYKFACEALTHLPSPHSPGGSRIKPVLTGPYTLAKFSLSKNGATDDIGELAAAYAEALALEMADLAEAGAEFIQIDEPAILKYPGDWTILEQALAPLLRARDQVVKGGKRLKLGLYVYFRDCAPLYDKLVSLPFDVIGLDFTYNWQLVDMVTRKGSPRPLGLGLIDGRNTKLEDPSIVARQIEKMLSKINGATAYLGPSCGLEYLPRDRALAKLGLLRRVRAELLGTPVSASGEAPGEARGKS
jgi:5-methyltetrahydropteroyltriglutamate--homocysteine methyltransferase